MLGDVPLSGAPDVIFLHPQLARLYVAIGDPGVIDVIDVGTMRRLEVVPTEPGAHTLALDRKRSKVYAFLPADPIAPRYSSIRFDIGHLSARRAVSQEWPGVSWWT